MCHNQHGHSFIRQFQYHIEYFPNHFWIKRSGNFIK
ncbi:Uncharacterised protein [Acinetobacter baumannii]|nr:Uncharacterised protein [Acinetobacter baumannii]